jgi:uncharacterized protein (TIGR02284 family)
MAMELVAGKNNSMDRNATLSQLEDLHELVADSRKGFLEAGNKVHDHQIAGFLMKLSDERQQMQTALALEIRRLAPDDANVKDGTLKGDLHRAWIDIREALAKAEEASILQECARGERYLLERYTTVIEEKKMPAETQRLLLGQRERIQLSLSTVVRLGLTAESHAH